MHRFYSSCKSDLKRAESSSEVIDQVIDRTLARVGTRRGGHAPVAEMCVCVCARLPSRISYALIIGYLSSVMNHCVSAYLCINYSSEIVF